MKYRQDFQEYISIVDGNAISTNELGFRVLELFNAGLSVDLVCKRLTEEGYSIDVQEVIRVRKALDRIRSKRSRGEYIKTIFSFSLLRWEWMIRILSKAFNLYVCIGVILLSICLLPTSAVVKLEVRDYFDLLYDNPYLLVLYLGVNVFILLFHELGHVAAAYRCNIPVEKLGVGIYLSYLVFYTDVTSSWLGTQKDRLLVDVGGLYFQLFLLAFFLLGECLTTGLTSVIFSLLFWDNLLVILFNLNPLAMFDGYWILSDALNIRNLRYKSMHSVGELFLFLKNRSKLSHKPVLYLYSIASLSFLIYLYWVIAKNLTFLLVSIWTIDFESVFWERGTLVFLMKLVFLSLGFLLFTRTLWNYYKNVSNYVRSL